MIFHTYPEKSTAILELSDNLNVKASVIGYTFFNK